MTTITRTELKEKLPWLISMIQKNHVMEDNIERELFRNNKPVKGLCHQRGYFCIAGEFYIQYLMDHVIVDPKRRLIGRAVQEVIFYDNYQEYESARVKQLSSSRDQTGLNYN